VFHCTAGSMCVLKSRKPESELIAPCPNCLDVQAYVPYMLRVMFYMSVTL